ncbi:MAG: beta-N-acetylhexosaminidase [Cyclobacteriaceae bacterium]|nr:beta-N-acetylhexosaminidase [Cyclobacteriaceae bacterium]
MSFKSFFVVFSLAFLMACTPSPEKSGVFQLLPQPQQFEITGNSRLKYSDIQNYTLAEGVNLPVRTGILKDISPVNDQTQAQIICNLDSSLNVKAEGYRLEISANQISITGKDQAGLMYGLMTLEQLMEDAKEQNVNLPLCSITDFPMLAFRAVHLDIKHHREKKEYYYSLLDKLQKYKINGIIAEVEDKLKYVRQPEVGSADAFTIEEWIDISNYARERNIEISPLVQGLGHASFILKHDIYKNLRDDPESDWAFNPLDSGTYQVQFDLYKDAIEATPHGKYLHVGGDEVHTTGRNSGKSSLELQLMWLDKVSKFAEENGRIPIFWDDMPLKEAGVYRSIYNTDLTRVEVDSIWKENEHKLLEFLDRFPKNCIYMRWNYDASQSEGNAKAMEWFMDHGLQVMGATAGQTRWVLMPQEESNMNNIRIFAAASIKNNLNGLLLTLWDDDSPHFELYMRGILAFAELTWTGDKRDNAEIKSAYRQREFSSTLAGNEYGFIDQLESPVAFWKNALLKGNRRNNLKTKENPLDQLVIDLPNGENKGEWTSKYTERLEQAAQVLQACDSVDLIIQKMKTQAIRNQYTLEVYEQVNHLVRFSSNALLILKAYDNASNDQEKLVALEQLDKLSEDFISLRKEFEEVYGQTRVLSKPEGYMLDQDHHVHMANQSVSFDWQFNAETLFLEKLEKVYGDEVILERK